MSAENEMRCRYDIPPEDDSPKKLSVREQWEQWQETAQDPRSTWEAWKYRQAYIDRLSSRIQELERDKLRTHAILSEVWNKLENLK